MKSADQQYTWVWSPVYFICLIMFYRNRLASVIYPFSPSFLLRRRLWYSRKKIYIYINKWFKKGDADVIGLRMSPVKLVYLGGWGITLQLGVVNWKVLANFLLCLWRLFRWLAITFFSLPPSLLPLLRRMQ